VRVRPSALCVSCGVRGRHSVGCDASFPGHPRPSSLAIILKNQYHTASQTEMRDAAALIAGTSGLLTETLCGVMEGPPLNATGGIGRLLPLQSRCQPPRRHVRRRGTARSGVRPPGSVVLKPIPQRLTSSQAESSQLARRPAQVPEGCSVAAVRPRSCRWHFLWLWGATLAP
jgi:hypothetical protein